MKIELKVGGRAVVIEAEGAVSVRVLEDEGAGRLGEDLQTRLEALRREIAEEAEEACGAETEPEGAAVSAAPAGWEKAFTAPAGGAGWDGVFVAAECEAPTDAPGFEGEAARAAVIDLFARLSGLRREIADAGGFPPYVVFNDRTLQEMAEKRPQDLAGLSAIKGVGAARLEKYGEAFLAAIKGVAA